MATLKVSFEMQVPDEYSEEMNYYVVCDILDKLNEWDVEIDNITWEKR